MLRLLRFLPIIIPIVTRILRSPRVQQKISKWTGSKPTGTNRSRPGTRNRKTGR